jgi:hypothetical protein
MIGTILGLARAALGAVSSIMGYFAQRKIDKRAKAAAQAEFLKEDARVIREAANARHTADTTASGLRDDPARRS